MSLQACSLVRRHGENISGALVIASPVVEVVYSTYSPMMLHFGVEQSKWECCIAVTLISIDQWPACGTAGCSKSCPDGAFNFESAAESGNVRLQIQAKST